MPYRLLFFAPLAPAVAVMALAAASGIAGAQDEPFTENALEDVQVGETENLMRVALICRMDCRVGARAGGSFFLPDIEAALDIDLQGRTKIGRSLAFAPVDGGSTLSINASAPVSRASIRPCLIDGLAASCIDIEFDRPATNLAANVGAVTAPRLAPRGAGGEGGAPADAAPELRDAPGEASLVFARFAPPERLAAPRSGSVAGPVAGGIGRQAAASFKPQSPAERPILREDRAERLIGREIDIATEAAVILGKRLGVAECGGAEARLRADAWALEAMVDVAFCKAMAGEHEDADGVFARLLAYTPDNYQALVGRALLAAKSGDRSLARQYFQEALEALPPIEESNRIVEAMASL